MAVRWRADLVSHNAKGLVLQIEHEAFLVRTVAVFALLVFPEIFWQMLSIMGGSFAYRATVPQ